MTKSLLAIVLLAGVAVAAAFGVELHHLLDQLGNALQHAGGGQ